MDQKNRGMIWIAVVIGAAWAWGAHSRAMVDRGYKGVQECFVSNWTAPHRLPENTEQELERWRWCASDKGLESWRSENAARSED